MCIFTPDKATDIVIIQFFIRCVEIGLGLIEMFF